MSADSPNHARPDQTITMQNLVTPQPVTDPTILDSVAGFINEVVPTAGNDVFDSKDQIQWARFEDLEWDESSFSPNCDSPLPSSLILVLGYTTGVQVWAIPANGEAMELFSWRHGSVKVLRILPAPYVVSNGNNRDLFESKRPLLALCDLNVHGSSTNTLNFYSLKTGEQVKQIKFKNQVLDVLANRRSVIITFCEKIAVFDAFNLEDKLSVTSCYLSPGIQSNPVALGPRWLAFAEKKLIASRRSSGGNEGEGVQSYTATVLHAAKSLGRGLRELGETVASSLTGNQNNKLGTSPNSPQAGGLSDVPQKGIITILDVESSTTQNADGSLHPESIVAHFVAHTEAIVWLQFGPCGMLLLTADKRGHDFNLFRINPHPVGPALAAVHHLYTLHRGDTSSRVQDMCFSFDSRWVTVSTLRGTTHVFPITPYGGTIGVRTHTTPHVVNKMSRFHRSAGLTSEGRSNSPVSMFESPVSSNFPYHNPRFPPFPHPTVVHPLAQLRQPVYMQNIGTTAPRQGRQRLTSSSEDNIALRVTACFASARAWIESTVLPRETTLKQVKPVESLFVMNCHGTLVQYDLEPHSASHIPKERVCDDSPIELTVIAKAQWRLQRQPASVDRPLPMSHPNLMFVGQTVPATKKNVDSNDDDWLSQVEIITHAGPHRRLWMGPQFTFKTYTTTNGTPLSLSDAQPLDLNRTKPVNMPITKANAVLIESSSASSSEQSLLDIYRKSCEEMGVSGEHQIKEDLADAMMESPRAREAGGRCVIVSMKPRIQPVAKVVNPLGTVVTVLSDEESEVMVPEDIVIYENCDEALFRPMVPPKTVAYHKSSKADSGNIMTKSLKVDTEVTVKILDRSQGLRPKEDNSFKKVDKNVDICSNKVEMTAFKSNLDAPLAKIGSKKFKTGIKSQNSTNLYDAVIAPVSNIAVEKPKNVPEECELVTKVSNKSKKTGDVYKLEESEKTVSIENYKQYSSDQKDEPDIKSGTKIQILSKCKKTEDLIEPMVSSNYSIEEFSADFKSMKKVLNKSKRKSTKTEATLVSSSPDKSREDSLERSKNTLKNLDTSKSISFPELDDKLLINSDFPPLEENFFSLENVSKGEKFEDARDCGLPLETLLTDESNKKDNFEDLDMLKLKKDELNELVSSDTVSTSEENILEDNRGDRLKKKSPLKKPRKPKTKLGVKIGNVTKEPTPERSENESTSEWSLTECSAEITLAPPKRSWSSIAATPQVQKSVEPSCDDPWTNNNIVEDTMKLSIELVIEESYTITLPKKSYSSCVTTQKLLDIDTPEENKESTVTVITGDLLKLDKSSDDEKADSGSSPVETTESDDSGKVPEGEVTKDVFEGKVIQPATKSSKRRLKKKKK